ncbi:hypothetical protein KC678_02240 [Candidatus Dojkabacteria bacterium]|uniref:Uncharacterized protein n=1 Tax=Candidatus Dojkabacteria bacterium TaxID=2099670 RepID=A0A955IAJ8_9BACT|nr:hypothetical protein [Candidatus Dojkabacteria bacterium]
MDQMIAPFQSELTDNLEAQFTASDSDFDQSSPEISNKAKLRVGKRGAIIGAGITIASSIIAGSLSGSMKVGSSLIPRKGTLEDIAGSSEQGERAMKNTAILMISNVVNNFRQYNSNQAEYERLDYFLENVKDNPSVEIDTFSYKRQETASSYQSQQSENQRGGEEEMSPTVHFNYAYKAGSQNANIDLADMISILNEDKEFVQNNFVVGRGQEIIITYRFKSPLLDSSANEYIEFTFSSGYNSSPVLAYEYFSRGNVERGSIVLATSQEGISVAMMILPVTSEQ